MSNLITHARCTSLSGGETPVGRPIGEQPRTSDAKLLPVRTVVLRTLALPLLLLALSATGCTAEVTTRHPAVVADEDVVFAPPPVNVYTYPQVVYRGEPAYYVGGRWYTRRGPYWGYYRQPPPDLVRHRRYVEAAPPAPRDERPRYQHQPPSGEAIRVR